MPEVLIPAERMLSEERVSYMRELLGSIASNDMTDIEELGAFIDIYNAHDVPKDKQIEFYKSLDIPEHNIIFGDSTFDTIVEEYDALGGLPREQVPLGAAAIPSELEISLGKAYVVVATTAQFLQTYENDSVESETLVERKEFDKFTDGTEFNKHMATKAWAVLAWRALVRVQPERFENKHWYKREDYANFPANLFEEYPARDADTSHGNYRRQVKGLRLDVLEGLLYKIEPTGSATIHEMFGEGVGPRTLQFLKEFVAYKRQRVEENTRTQ